jgi:hypothetical protein
MSGPCPGRMRVLPRHLALAVLAVPYANCRMQLLLLRSRSPGARGPHLCGWPCTSWRCHAHEGGVFQRLSLVLVLNQYGSTASADREPVSVRVTAVGRLRSSASSAYTCGDLQRRDLTGVLGLFDPGARRVLEGHGAVLVVLHKQLADLLGGSELARLLAGLVVAVWVGPVLEQQRSDLGQQRRGSDGKVGAEDAALRFTRGHGH